MQAVTEVPVRKPVKQPPFGALIGQFGKQEGVAEAKEDFLSAQEQGNSEKMRRAEDIFYELMRGSSYRQEVSAEARTLTEETRAATGPGRSTSGLQSTRLDFAAQAIWQVPVPRGGEDSSDTDAIEAMRMSASQGGYQLAWFEALYRGRGEGNEEGVGPFITPLLDLHISDIDAWVAFKQQEFRWVHYNFNRQGLAVSVNLFPSDFLQAGIVETLLQLHREDAVAFKFLHVELLEHEDSSLPEIVQAIRNVHAETGLMLAKDDVGPDTLSDPVKRRHLIELFRSLSGALTVLKLDSSLVCGALNVPLVPRSFSRAKMNFDAEVASKRRYREAWAVGMSDKDRKFDFPLNLVDSDHFTTKSVVRTYANPEAAVSHAADVVQGWLEVSQALEHAVDIVAEVSIYANDFQRQLEHPIFGAFVKSLLLYARKGRLFIQGSMCGGRAVSDAIVPLLVATPVRDASQKMKELLAERQSSPHGGAEESYHISEDFGVYEDKEKFGEAVRRVKVAGESCSTKGQPQCPACWACLLRSST